MCSRTGALKLSRPETWSHRRFTEHGLLDGASLPLSSCDGSKLNHWLQWLRSRHSPPRPDRQDEKLLVCCLASDVFGI